MAFGWVKTVVFSKWALLAGIAVACWQGWTVLRPKPWAPDELQKAAADNVCRRAAQAIPPRLGGVEKIVVLRLAGHDDDGYVTARLGECVQKAGGYSVLHETFVSNLMRELKIDRKGVSTLEEAVAAGRKIGVSGVIFGDVPEFRRDEASASIRLNIRLARVDTAQSLFAESFTQTEPPSPASIAGVRKSVNATSVVKRILVWLAFAAIVPLLLIPVLKRFLERESNAVNLALLVALTLLDLVLAFFLCGLDVFAWIPGILLVLAVVAGGLYNYWLCSTIEGLRK